jgi:hypothetical protein
MEDIQVEDVKVIKTKPVMKKENTKTKKCKSCTKVDKTSLKLNPKHILLTLLGFYMLFSMIYGTIQLIKNIF